MSHEIAKLIEIGQRNAAQLKSVIKKQEKLEEMMVEQKEQISEIVSLLNRRDAEIQLREEKGKGKNKSKVNEEFYQVSIYDLCVYLHCSFIFAYNYLTYRVRLKNSLASYFTNMKTLPIKR